MNNRIKLPDAITERWCCIERCLPLAVVIVSLSITYLLWQHAHHASIQAQQSEFDSRASDTVDRLLRRITYYEQILHGVRGFYLNQNKMEPQEFKGYIASLAVERNFPGIQGISFAQLVDDKHKSAYTASLRQSGFPDFTILPEGKRPSYAPVIYIEPMTERNARVLGFDNLSNPTRTATVEQARDEDRAVISEKLILKQENGSLEQEGFLMFLPVFKRGTMHDTLANRRANIEGWFAASFRMADIMARILDKRAEGLSVEVFDGNMISEPSRMYAAPAGIKRNISPLFATVVPVMIAGHQWTIRLSSTPDFEMSRNSTTEQQAVAAGGFLGLLLLLINWLLMRDRKRAMRMAATISLELEMRKQAEHKTQELHVFNEAILEKSPAGIAVYTASGLCVMANEAYAKAIGATTKDVLKQNFRDNASWKRNGLLDLADQAFKTGLTIRQDIAGETSFGKEVMLECIFASINISGQPHLLLLVNDVSDRAKAEHALTASMRQLEQKELAKTRFLAAAGHDLRQPIAAANLFIDALKLTEMTPRQGEIINRLDKSMNTFTDLLDSLLNVSKLDAGIIKPEYAPVNVTEIFNWVEQNFAPTMTAKQLDFRLYFPMSQPLVILSDIGLLKSVLMNLVSNAIKFTAQGGILVSARRRGSDVLFQVWDTGIGIPDEYIEQIFDEFYQVSNPQRDRTSGLGLGLSIAKRALTLLGRKISCRSQTGRGSVFEFSLPLETSQAGFVPAATGKPAQETNNLFFAKGKRFVVVEDDKLVAQAMINWLEGMGGTVNFFHNAEDALHHANIVHADYYIVDFMLGATFSGIEFLNLIRQKLGKPIKAVVVTGDTSTSFIRHAEECEWPVLHKPINTSRLIAELIAQDQTG